MRKTLVLFWHGLGDNILATPAIRQFKLATGDFVGWAMLRRFKGAQLMDFNPYIDRLHYVSDAWNDFGDYGKGISAVTNEARAILARFAYDRLIVVDHTSSKKHKIMRTADELGVRLDLDSLRTEVWYPKGLARERICNLGLPSRFAFFHGKTGVSDKDLPISGAYGFLSKHGLALPIVSPDFTWDYTKEPIYVSFEVMCASEILCLADSVMYHAAHAMGLKIDLAYFKRGEEIWKVVRPLHDASEEVAFSLPR